MDEENKTLKSQIEIHEAQEKDLGSQIKDLSRKLDNLEAQVRTQPLYPPTSTNIMMAVENNYLL